MGNNCCRQRHEQDQSSISSILDDIIMNPQPTSEHQHALRESFIKSKINIEDEQNLEPIEEQIQLPGGSNYKGITLKGVPHGKGIEKHQNGDIYKGEFYEGLKQGNGQYMYHDGSKYCGEFKGGKISGQGQMFWKNGDHYQGSFVNNIINGYGKYYSKQKNVTYQGQYKNGKRHGKGHLSGDGIQIQGIWDNGRFIYDSFNYK